jgi:hypothetical protein
MRKIREVLRLHSDLACTHRQIASACHISPSTVGAYLERAAEAGLTWADAAPLTEVEVEARLFTYVGRSEPKARAAIDFDWVHVELARPGVTLQLLWGEYQVAAREAQVLHYQYSQFCELYAAWRNQRRLSMRQTHRPGASALARIDPPPLARKGPRQDRRSDDSGGLGRRGQRQAQVMLDVVARGKRPTTGGAKRGRGRGKSAGDGSRGGARDRGCAIRRSEWDRTVGTGIDDERDTIALDGAAERERLRDDSRGDVGGVGGGLEVRAE